MSWISWIVIIATLVVVLAIIAGGSLTIKLDIHSLAKLIIDHLYSSE